MIPAFPFTSNMLQTGFLSVPPKLLKTINISRCYDVTVISIRMRAHAHVRANIRTNRNTLHKTLNKSIISMAYGRYKAVTKAVRSVRNVAKSLNQLNNTHLISRF